MTATSRSTGNNRSGSRSTSAKAKPATTAKPQSETTAQTPSKAAAKKPPAPRQKPAAKQQPPVEVAPVPATITTEQQLQMIAEAAYYIAEQRGFAGDESLADWLTAEAQIAALLSSPSTSTH